MNQFLKPEIISLKGVEDNSGDLYFLEESMELPFAIARSFWIIDVPEGGKRGVHAHKEETQVLIAVQGTLEVSLEKGEEVMSFSLSSPKQALILPAMYWSEVTFSKKAILLGFSNRKFSESDYIRDKNEFNAL
ncbi:WxcM-like protein [Belliella baltica DSM 15883]|uniref:WxcM-like protein n=1 Tax=Belliella baltica (strain DSM 15883 / CIP 108006 / LMG 21964 / BA134) TaxID=866536 RepID=I3Z0N2_BELBD|nr:FdtA/QdtA family cupin domain-containing protein [Belliella baltica]AFL82800.1 WxcM-like protein [Belliella baltica DSM 15883]